MALPQQQLKQTRTKTKQQSTCVAQYPPSDAKAFNCTKKQLTVHLAWQPSMQQLKQTKKLKQWPRQAKE